MTNRETRRKLTFLRRQNQILGAALDIFSQKGFSAATIPEIAKQAGIATGTIYIYYPSKRELFIAAIERLLVSPLIEIFEKDTGAEFRATLKEALQERLQILQSVFLARFLALMSEIQRDPELKILFKEKLIQPFLLRMERMYQIRIASGEFRKMDPAIVARLVGGLMIGTTLLRGLEGEDSPLNKLSRNQLVNEILNFVLFGLMNDKREPEKEPDR